MPRQYVTVPQTVAASYLILEADEAIPAYGSMRHVLAAKAVIEDDGLLGILGSFINALRGFFSRQERVVVGRLRRAARQGDSALAEAAANPFELADWNRRLRRASEPAITAALINGGDRIATSVGVSFDQPNRPAIEHMAQREQQFVEPVNQTTWERLRGSLTEGIAQGESLQPLMNRVAQEFQAATPARIEAIARTETIGAANAGSLAAAKQTRVLGTKIWLSALDDRTRESHRAVHGTEIPMDADFTVGAVQGQAPGQLPSAREVVNCRCTLAYRKRARSPRPDASGGSPIDGGFPDAATAVSNAAVAEATQRAVNRILAEASLVRRGHHAAGLHVRPTKARTAYGPRRPIDAAGWQARMEKFGAASDAGNRAAVRLNEARQRRYDAWKADPANASYVAEGSLAAFNQFSYENRDWLKQNEEAFTAALGRRNKAIEQARALLLEKRPTYTTLDIDVDTDINSENYHLFPLMAQGKALNAEQWRRAEDALDFTKRILSPEVAALRDAPNRVPVSASSPSGPSRDWSSASEEVTHQGVSERQLERESGTTYREFQAARPMDYFWFSRPVEPLTEPFNADRVTIVSRSRSDGISGSFQGGSGSEEVAYVKDGRQLTRASAEARDLSFDPRAEGWARTTVGVTATRPTIMVGESEPVSTYVHELGHHIEQRIPAIHAAARQFRDERLTGGEETYQGQTVLSGKFPSPYYGRDYGTRSRATEVFSSALGDLYENPVKFAREQPETFRWLMKTLKGVPDRASESVKIQQRSAVGTDASIGGRGYRGAEESVRERRQGRWYGPRNTFRRAEWLKTDEGKAWAARRLR